MDRDSVLDGLWTFDAVEERLVEAMRLWWRAPDRERGWLHIKAMWPDFRRHNWWGDYADTEAEPRRARLTRQQIAEMEEAAEWMRFVPERDRRLVGLAILALASGKARVPWLALRRPMGVKLGADGLRRRYERAVSRIAFALNG
jgi:hypothetical protein